MADTTVRQEISRARRIVARLEEIEQVESSVGPVPQTYQPAPLLLPGQQVYPNISAPLRRPSLVVVLKVDLASMRIPSTTPPTRAPTTPLLSVRMKTTLSRLRHEFEKYPREPGEQIRARNRVPRRNRARPPALRHLRDCRHSRWLPSLV
jgi:hypothetical protein